MTDVFTVFRKEVLEIASDRHSLRGSLLQAAITVFVTGLLVPAMQASVWSEVTAMMMLYVVFPSSLAATLSADAFAGENERRTLETLLATPLTERAIFTGKMAIAVAFCATVATVSLVAGLATAAIAGHSTAPVVPIAIAGILGGAISGSVVVAAASAAISVRVAFARSAQQMGSLLTFALAGVAVSLLRVFGTGLSWSVILAADIVVLVAGVISICIGIAMFRRSRFFDER